MKPCDRCLKTYKFVTKIPFTAVRLCNSCRAHQRKAKGGDKAELRSLHKLRSYDNLFKHIMGTEAIREYWEDYE